MARMFPLLDQTSYTPAKIILFARGGELHELERISFYSYATAGYVYIRCIFPVVIRSMNPVLSFFLTEG